jgi:hypothetical protein
VSMSARSCLCPRIDCIGPFGIEHGPRSGKRRPNASERAASSG